MSVSMCAVSKIFANILRVFKQRFILYLYRLCPALSPVSVCPYVCLLVCCIVYISRLKRETDSEQRKNGQTEIASRALNPFCLNTSCTHPHTHTHTTLHTHTCMCLSVGHCSRICLGLVSYFTITPFIAAPSSSLRVFKHEIGLSVSGA